jgi:hypothetical protein
MALDLDVGIPVTDVAAALAWSERLLGAPPTLVVSDTEAVWDLAAHRSVYIAQLIGRQSVIGCTGDSKNFRDWKPLWPSPSDSDIPSKPRRSLAKAPL